MDWGDIAMNWTMDRYALVEDKLRKLAEQHREIQEGSLHLAMAYDPGRECEDIFLFEVLGGFGLDEVNPEGDFFEVTYESSRGFPMNEGQMLHLVLANLPELRVGLADHWKSAEEIRDAVRRGDFRVLYEDEIGRTVLELFHD